MNKAIDVAKYVINYCIDKGCPITNLQLQCLLYYLQQDFLQLTGKPLFEDDFTAWQFGPAIGDVYRHFCGFGALDLDIKVPEEFVFSEKHKIFMDFTIIQKKRFDLLSMRSDICKDGLAWAQVYNGSKGLYYIIPKKLIKKG